MITLIPTIPLADDDLVALVEENFRQALGESARSIARLLNMQMLRVEPGFGLIVDPAEG